MSYEAARQAFFNLLQTGWAASEFAAVPVEWENLDQIDHNTQTGPFLTAQIKWGDAEQASMELDPQKRQHGEFKVDVHVKQGKGTRDALRMVDVLEGILQWKRPDGIQLCALRPEEPEPFKGWYITPTRTSFHYHD